MDLARRRADYCLFIDADEEFNFSKNFKLPELEKGYYFIPTVDLSHNTFQRIHLVKNTLDWHWYGIIHEYLFSDQAESSEILSGIKNIATKSDGNRSQDSQKHQKDLLVLKKALENEPNNSRCMFYLAQTYFNAKDYESALRAYGQRALMEGDEEVFYSLYMIGKIKQILKKPEQDVIESYVAAYLNRPTRAEPLS